MARKRSKSGALVSGTAVGGGVGGGGGDCERTLGNRKRAVRNAAKALKTSKLTFQPPTLI